MGATISYVFLATQVLAGIGIVNSVVPDGIVGTVHTVGTADRSFATRHIKLHARQQDGDMGMGGRWWGWLHSALPSSIQWGPNHHHSTHDQETGVSQNPTLRQAQFSQPQTLSSTTPSTATYTSAPSDSSDYMSIVNKWRRAGHLSALAQSSLLEANALKTAQDGHGQMRHELNPGSLAQVLAPGKRGSFESVYLGGWLCERPDLPGLNDICSTMAQGWDHSNGDTGHADILTNLAYTKIGCAWADNIWACDLA